VKNEASAPAEAFVGVTDLSSKNGTKTGHKTVKMMPKPAKSDHSQKTDRTVVL
jgi:hypothetical protein